MKKKKVIVNSGGWTKSITIDSSIFEDVYIEACTQIVEIMLKTQKKIKVAAVINCYKEKDEKNIITYNTYKILINAGLHKYAEILRKNLYQQTKIDWADEPIKSI